jgi:hypothetical protein
MAHFVFIPTNDRRLHKFEIGGRVEELAGNCRPRPSGWVLRRGPGRRDTAAEMGGRVSSPTLVGRVEELRVLEAARVRAAAGEPAVVLLGGEAGVGKSRLLAELAARCSINRTPMLIGGCLPVGGDELPTLQSWRRCGPYRTNLA